MRRLFQKRAGKQARAPDAPRSQSPTAGSPRSTDTDDAADPAANPADAGTAQAVGARRRRRRPRSAIAFALVLIAIAATALTLATMPGRRPRLEPRTGPALTDATSWGYQLQNVSVKRIPDAVDLLVVDYSRDGTDEQRFAAATVERLKTRADGRRRVVLAYLSIGEAERYRYYWRRTWAVVPPRWLGPENKDWRGNFSVRYWDPAWQKLLFDVEPSLLDVLLDRVAGLYAPYVDRILEAGFDGLYLDRVDGYGDWDKSRTTAQAEMADLVMRLSRYAKERRPGTLIVTQNGEELLVNPRVLKAIDGVAKEDLVYGNSGEETANPAGDVAASVGLLNRAKRAGLPVFVVEYLDDAVKQANARARITPMGFPLLFAKRPLNEPPPDPKAPAPAASPPQKPASGSEPTRRRPAR